MVRARSRASFIGVPLTAVMTSPDSIPALAAGLPFCGPSTIAPSAFFMPRLSAMSLSYGLNLDAEPSARHDSFIFELGNYPLRCLRRDIKANADRTARGR